MLKKKPISGGQKLPKKNTGAKSRSLAKKGKLEEGKRG